MLDSPEYRSNASPTSLEPVNASPASIRERTVSGTTRVPRRGFGRCGGPTIGTTSDLKGPILGFDRVRPTALVRPRVDD
jgi:hypothetical protein